MHRPKRHQVPSACQACRVRKAKCDGQKPCTPCVQREAHCTYTTREHETQQQALKRKHNDLTDSYKEMSRLHECLATSDEQMSTNVPRHIRRGRSIKSALEYASTGGAVDAVATSYTQTLRRNLVLQLIQSTAPFHKIVGLSNTLLNSQNRINFPAKHAWQGLKNRIITLELIYGVVKDANPSHEQIGAVSDQHTSTASRFVDTSYTSPLYWVPVAHWTRVTSSDDAVSHLVTFFLTFVNPYWRFVEEDLFLANMRHCHMPSPYCSPSLVNAILAVASLFSDIPEAYAEADQPLTRGHHFQKEALRLLELEEVSYSITYLQATSILALDGPIRGIDKQAWSWLVTSASLNREIPMSSAAHSQGTVVANYERARACAASTVVWYNITYTLGMRKPPTDLAVTLDDAPELLDILPDTSNYWMGYPLSREPQFFRPNRLVCERWNLACFEWKLLHLLYSSTTLAPIGELIDSAKSLGSSLHDWYSSLPPELCYSGRMPAGVYELHGEYLCAQLLLHSQTFEAIIKATSRTEVLGAKCEHEKAEFHHNILHWIHKIASLLSGYRETYGLKIVLPWIIQPAANALNVLLRDLQLFPEVADEHRAAESGSNHLGDREASFEECFRTLVAAGMQLMLPRSIARMIYYTAIQLGVRLPIGVTELIRVIAETAWQPSDLQLLDSEYPNQAMAGAFGKEARDYQMEEVLRKWEALAMQDENNVASSSAIY